MQLTFFTYEITQTTRKSMYQTLLQR